MEPSQPGLEVDTLLSATDVLIVGAGALSVELKRILANRNLSTSLVSSQQQIDPSISPEFIFWVAKSEDDRPSEFLLNFAKTIRSKVALIGFDHMDLSKQLSLCVAADVDARVVIVHDLYGPAVTDSRLSIIWKDLAKGVIVLPDHDSTMVYPLAIDDAAAALCLSVFSSQTYNHTVALAGATEMTILNFAYKLRDAAIRHHGREFKFVHTQENVSEDQDRVAKLAARDESYGLLSWKPETDLAEGLTHLVGDLLHTQAPHNKKKINQSSSTSSITDQQKQAVSHVPPPQEESHSEKENQSQKETSRPIVVEEISKSPRRRSPRKFTRVVLLAVGIFLLLTGIVLSPFLIQKMTISLGVRLTSASQLGDAAHATTFMNDMSRIERAHTVALALASPFWNVVRPGWSDQQRMLMDDVVHRGQVELEMSKVVENTGKLAEIAMGSSSEHPVVTMGQLEAQSSTLLALLGSFSQSGQTEGGFGALRQSVSFARELIPVAKWVLGFDRKRTLLVVLQDASELRPTGGFITSVGFLTMEKGKLLDLTFRSIYDIDSSLPGQEQAPEPIRRLTGEDRWLARDGNWSSDGPAAAIHLEQVIQRATGRDVDGTIFLTSYGLKRILSETGPVMSAHGEDISADNLIERATFGSQSDAAAGGDEDVLSDAAKGLRGALSAQHSGLYLRGILNAMSHGELFLASHDPNVSVELSRLHLDGALGESGCPVQFRVEHCVTDVIGVVDANLGANKVDYFLTRERTIAVTVAPNKSTVTTVTLRYRNTSDSTTRPAGIYHGYTRVYLPPDAIVSSVVQDQGGKTSDVMLDHDVEFGKHVEGFYVHVPIKGEVVIRLSYTRSQNLFKLEQGNGVYNLLLIKQPGVESAVTSVSVQYDSSIAPIAVSPESYSSNNSLLFYLIGDKTTNVAVEFSSVL